MKYMKIVFCLLVFVMVTACSEQNLNQYAKQVSKEAVEKNNVEGKQIKGDFMNGPEFELTLPDYMIVSPKNASTFIYEINNNKEKVEFIYEGDVSEANVEKVIERDEVELSTYIDMDVKSFEDLAQIYYYKVKSVGNKIDYSILLRKGKHLIKVNVEQTHVGNLEERLIDYHYMIQSLKIIE